MTSLVLIDPRVAAYEVLLQDMAPDTEVLVLDQNQDGIQQIAAWLDGRSGIDALHVVSHGSEATLYLGSSVLTPETLELYRPELHQIGVSLTESGDILLYGCNVAAGDTGQEFINTLAHYAGADVAASTDLSGAATLGGDWQLEASTGAIEASTLDAPDYTGTLPASDSPHYDISLMTDMAELANVSYDADSGLINLLAQHGWTFLEQLSIPSLLGPEQEDFGFVAGRTLDGKNQIVIAFRGTEDLYDWVMDFSDFGFTQVYHNLRPLLANALNNVDSLNHDADPTNDISQVFITGHSLGGAVAQAAYLDIFAPQDVDIWGPLQLDNGLLDSGDRIGNISGLDQQALDQIQDLTVATTFGAPGLNMDPLSPVDINPLTLQVTRLQGFGNHSMGFFSATVENLINGAEIKNRLFQFEHTDEVYSELTDDPVAEFGGELGSLINAAPDSVAGDKYLELVHYWIADLHKMDVYEESLLRAAYDIGGISGVPGTENIHATASDSCPPNSEGNDIFVVSATDDNVSLTLSGGNDRLVLGGIQSPSATVEGSDLILSWSLNAIASPHTLTIEDWYADTGDHQFVQVSTVPFNPDISSSAGWITDKDYLNTYDAASTLANLGIPWYLQGGAREDVVYGSQASDTVSGHGGRDYVYGQDGDDILYGDTQAVAGGGGDWLYGGKGSDTLYGGEGDDFLAGEDGADHVLGQAGKDALYSQGDGDLLEGGSGLDVYFLTTPGAVTVYEEAADAGGDQIHVRFDGIDADETRFVQSGDDLVVKVRDSGGNVLATVNIQNMAFVTGQVKYLGLYDDATSNLLRAYALKQAWVDAPMMPDGVNAIIPAMPFSGINILTSGDDLFVCNSTEYTDDLVYALGGNDILHGNIGHDELHGGSGNDVLYGEGLQDLLYGEDGDDVLVGAYDAIYGGAGDDDITVTGGGIVDGGAGYDVLTFNGSNLPSLAYTVTTANTTTDLRYYTDFAIIHDALANAKEIIIGKGAVRNIDELHLNGVDNGSYPGAGYIYKGDLLIYQGAGGSYDGGGQQYSVYDTFYADWSATTSAIVWNNTPSITQTINGVEISDVERLLLKTGSGDDVIKNTQVSAPDYIDTGAGDDIVESGSGNDAITTKLSNGGDIIYTGMGNDHIVVRQYVDFIDAGPGDDMIVYLIDGEDISHGMIDGGEGNDSLTVDFSGLTDHGLTIGKYGVWQETGVVTYGDVESLVSYEEFVLCIYDYGYLPDDISSVIREGEVDIGNLHIENVNIVGTPNDDIIVYLGGDNYLGNDEKTLDTFYANWSGIGPPIIWHNNAGVEQQLSNGVTVGGFERLWIHLGSGADLIECYLTDAEDRLYLGAGDDTASGYSGDDHLYGEEGNDVLVGGDGNDYLDGGIGNDVLNGGDGWNNYIVDSTQDVVINEANNDLPRGTVTSSVSWVLDPGLEILELTGSASINGTGNDSHNRLYGNVGDNILDGCGGGDWMYGGAGDDTFIVDSFDDNVFGNDGVDIVMLDLPSSEENVIMPGDLENVTALGAANLVIRGTDSDNVIIGNSGDNYLIGRAGNDSLSGADGNDILYGDAGMDNLTGGIGNDILNGGTGADVLVGGVGNDVYSVDDVADIVVEGADGGFDTVYSSAGILWLDHVEKFFLTGSGNLNLTGQSTRVRHFSPDYC